MIGKRKFILFLIVIIINILFKLFGIISENAYILIMKTALISFAGANSAEWLMGRRDYEKGRPKRE